MIKIKLFSLSFGFNINKLARLMFISTSKVIIMCVEKHLNIWCQNDDNASRITDNDECCEHREKFTCTNLPKLKKIRNLFYEKWK